MGTVMNEFKGVVKVESDRKFNPDARRGDEPMVKASKSGASLLVALITCYNEKAELKDRLKVNGWQIKAEKGFQLIDELKGIVPDEALNTYYANLASKKSAKTEKSDILSILMGLKK